MALNFQSSSRILQKIPKPSVHQTEIHIWKVEKIHQCLLFNPKRHGNLGEMKFDLSNFLSNEYLSISYKI